MGVKNYLTCLELAQDDLQEEVIIAVLPRSSREEEFAATTAPNAPWLVLLWKRDFAQRVALAIGQLKP